jgi:ubiquinone/menaquinone biosynthesis C-methylase UbiE
MTADRFRTYWDGMAPSYDARIAWVERRFLATSRRWIAERVEGEVLEIAVGTGAMLPYYPSGTRLTGFEWSRPMLDVARRRADALGLAMDLRDGDAMALPADDASYDTVVSTFAMCCVPDHRVALAEAARVLRPGGRLLLADHVVSTSAPLRFAQRLLDRITVPGQNEHWTRRPHDHLGAVGFEVVESVRRTYGAIEQVHARRQST